MDHGQRKKRGEADHEPLPANNEPTILFLEPGQGALGLEAWHVLLNWPAP